ARLLPDVHVKLHSLEPVAMLTSEKLPAPATLVLERGLPPGAYGPADVAFRLADAAWLEVAPGSIRVPSAPAADQARQLSTNIPLQIQQKAGAERSLTPRPLGFLAQARFEGRDYHVAIAVPLQAQPREVQVFLSADPVKLEPVSNIIRLRPNKTPQPY